MISDNRLAYVNIYDHVWCVVWKARWPVGLGVPSEDSLELWSERWRESGCVLSVCLCVSICRSAYPCGQGDGGRVNVCSVCVCVCVCVCVWGYAGQCIPIPTTTLVSLVPKVKHSQDGIKSILKFLNLRFNDLKINLTCTYGGSSELHHNVMYIIMYQPFYPSVFRMTLYQYKMMKYLFMNFSLNFSTRT